MKNKICCCFGHRNVYADVNKPLANAIERLIIADGVTIFLTGGMGEFDSHFSSAVRAAKRRYPNIKLILIKPYFSKELNENKNYYESLYDSVEIPNELVGMHFKAAITERNRWMIERSDMVLTFVHRDFGGAFDAVKYARKLQKPIIELADQIHIP